MLTGFNTNVRHRGLLPHVQTEDSGRAHPHIITHLYHGGTIVASEKCQYGDRLTSENLVAEVRSLMEGQHRTMLKRLKRGELDALLAERVAIPLAPAPAPAMAADTLSATAPVEAEVPAQPEAAAPAAALAAAPVTVTVTVVDERADGLERPLDEVVLEYLVERARRRQRRQP